MDPSLNNGSQWKPVKINSNTTVDVGTGRQFTDPQSAWDFFSRADIVSDANVTIQIHNENSSSPHIYHFYTDFILKNTHGSQIKIVGVADFTPTYVLPATFENGEAAPTPGEQQLPVLLFHGTTGVKIDGSEVGRLEKLEIRGSYTGPGILCYNKSRVTLERVTCYQWGDGIVATDHSTITTTSNSSAGAVLAVTCSGDGIKASNGSEIHLGYATCQNCGWASSPSAPGSGYHCIFGSQIVGTRLYAAYCYRGLWAQSNAVITTADSSDTVDRPTTIYNQIGWVVDVGAYIHSIKQYASNSNTYNYAADNYNFVQTVAIGNFLIGTNTGCGIYRN
jgi:hypothetical protein